MLKLDVEVNDWLWDATQNTWKGNRITVNEYSMIDGEFIRKFESIRQITETYQNCTKSKQPVANLIHGNILGKLKGSLVPQVATHVKGRIFQKNKRCTTINGSSID